MAALLNKRSGDRFEIEGAQIKYRKLSGKKIGGKFHGPLNLNNISNNGAGFEIIHDYNIGDSVLVDISIPNEENIHVCGVVQWIKSGVGNLPDRAGIQFSKFGWGESWNFVPYEARLSNIVDYHNQTERIE